MSTLLKRLLFASFLLQVEWLSAQQSCFDSIHFEVEPVQCYSYRNGEITIDSIFGGSWPFYYSLDGSTFSTRNFFDRLYPGDYTLTIRDKDGCQENLPFTIDEPEIVEVVLKANLSSAAPGQPVVLSAYYDSAQINIQGISWRPPELFAQQNRLVQTVSISQTTVFAVEIVSDGGCTARDQVIVEEATPKMYFPNIIHIGSNENAYFTAYADESIKQIKSMKIYSRDGSLVFENYDFQPNDQLLGWNGKAIGKRVQPGVFTWVAVIQLLDDSLIQRTGSVTVVK